MKIGLRGGHSPNCKGAIGILDEQAEVRKIYNELAPMLKNAGHTVIDCNSNSSTVNGELSDGTNKANNNGCNIYVTIHMNASGGEGNGTEVWMYDASNSSMNSYANKICSNFAAKGFQNRGVKYSTGYHDLCASTMPAMIVETLFCDNSHDANLYKSLGAKGIASLISNAIVGTSITTGSSTSTNSNDNKIYRIRKTWEDAKSQIGAYRNLDSAKKECKEGYSVFDWNGKVVYSNKPTTTNSTTTQKLYRVRKSWNDAKSQIGAYASLESAKKVCTQGYTVYDWNGKAVYTSTTTNNSEENKPAEDTKPPVVDDTTVKEYPDISPLKGFTKEQFIEYIGERAKKDMKNTGVLASVTIAQAILESAYGQSELSLKANNLFGMKASLSGNTWDSEWDGTSYDKYSPEEIDGKVEQKLSRFRMYNTVEASIKDHSDYLLGAKNGTKLRYEGLKNEKDYHTAIQIIKNGGYATDSGYVDKVCDIIKKYELYKYDEDEIIVDEDDLIIIEDSNITETVKGISNILSKILEILQSIFALFSKTKDK